MKALLTTVFSIITLAALANNGDHKIITSKNTKATTVKAANKKTVQEVATAKKKTSTKNNEQYNATVVSADGLVITTYEPVFEKKKIKYTEETNQENN